MNNLLFVPGWVKRGAGFLLRVIILVAVILTPIEAVARRSLAQTPQPYASLGN